MPRRKGLGTAAAQPREMPTGEPKSMEGTRVPRSHEASEDEVQRIGGQSSHRPKDAPDVSQEWSGVAERQQEEQREAVRRRKCHQLWRGLEYAGPAQSSDAETEVSVRSPDKDEPSEAPPKLDATRQVGQGLISGVLAPRGRARTEYSYPGSDGGEGHALRVNMIRVHGKQGEERNEPKFGDSRAAPPQGADSGRPSGSGEHRGVGQERKMEPTGVQPQYNLGSFRFKQPHQRQEVLDVSYSTVSSDERYDGAGRCRGARPKTSTLVPEVGYKSCLYDTPRPLYSNDGSPVLGIDRAGPGVYPVDKDPWNKVMLSESKQPEQRRGTVEDRLEKVVDVMLKSLANLIERIAAVEFDGNRSGETKKSCFRAMKLETYDGTTSVDTFLAKFEICSEHNGLREEERLAQLQCALTSNAAQILWDTDTGGAPTSADLISQLRARHGFEQQAHSYRAQLKCRRRIKGESLAALIHDIRRMVALAYSGPISAVKDSVACDAFLDALDDSGMALKIRKREPESLEQAFRVAQRLESYTDTGSGYPSERNDSEAKKRCRAGLEAVDGVSEDPWVKCLRELGSQHQEHLLLLRGGLEDAVTSLKSGQADVVPEFGDSVPRATPVGSWKRTTEWRRRPRKSAVTGYGCGRLGHYRNRCPNAPGHNVGEIDTPRAVAANRHINGQSGLYLRMKIGKKLCYALLDTGSEITLIPRSLVGGAILETSNQHLRAANETEIVVKGETTIIADLGSFRLPLKCLVVEDVSEILIGMDWLLENAAVIDFKNQSMKIGGRMVGLTKATPDSRKTDCVSEGRRDPT